MVATPQCSTNSPKHIVVLAGSFFIIIIIIITIIIIIIIIIIISSSISIINYRGEVIISSIISNVK